MAPPLPPPPAGHVTQPRPLVFPTSGPSMDFSADAEPTVVDAGAEPPPRPHVFFPTSGSSPVTRAHQDLRTDLYLTACRLFEQSAWVGSNQYVYYDGSDPSKWVAPDLFVRRGGPDEHFASWKVWDRGAPELAIEIVREEEATPAHWARKLGRYHAVGVVELVRFEADSDTPLRVWDRVRDNLVERQLEMHRATSRVLGLALVVVGATLRWAQAAEALLTPTERADAEARRADRFRAKLVAAGIDPEE